MGFSVGTSVPAVDGHIALTRRGSALHRTSGETMQCTSRDPASYRSSALFDPRGVGFVDVLSRSSDTRVSPSAAWHAGFPAIVPVENLVHLPTFTLGGSLDWGIGGQL